MNPILKWGAPLVIGVFLGVISVSFAGFIVGLFIGIVVVAWDLHDEGKPKKMKVPGVKCRHCGGEYFDIANSRDYEAKKPFVAKCRFCGKVVKLTWPKKP